MKLLLLIILPLLYLSPLYAQEMTHNGGGEPIARYGYVYKGMPKDKLSLAGYTKLNLVSYEKDDGVEYMTFSDWVTPQYGDTVTFVIIDGKVDSWIRAGEFKALLDKDT